MAYLVSVAARAERDLAAIFERINAASSGAALRWYIGLKNAVLSLEEAPNRCPRTPKRPNLRHLLYGHKPHVYRVIFRVLEKQKRVDVLHIRHGARQQLKSSALL